MNDKEKKIDFINYLSSRTQDIIRSRYRLYLGCSYDINEREKLHKERDARLRELEEQRIKDINEIMSEKITNFEKIKNMDIEEMAKFLKFETDCIYCSYNKVSCDNIIDCIQGIKQWLQLEAEDFE